jgi:hypothetical protein
MCWFKASLNALATPSSCSCVLLAYGPLLEMSQRANPWQAAATAIALAKLGSRDGFEFIHQRLNEYDPVTAYPVALMVAETGRPALAELVGSKPEEDLEFLVQSVSDVLDKRPPKNCLEERYADYLLRCLKGTLGTRDRRQLQTLHPYTG